MTRCGSRGLPVPVYLLHIFEEYGAHVTDGQFDLVLMFQKMGIDEMFGGSPLFFFPYINITAMWVFAADRGALRTQKSCGGALVLRIHGGKRPHPHPEALQY